MFWYSSGILVHILPANSVPCVLCGSDGSIFNEIQHGKGQFCMALHGIVWHEVYGMA